MQTREVFAALSINKVIRGGHTDKYFPGSALTHPVRPLPPARA